MRVCGMTTSGEALIGVIIEVRDGAWSVVDSSPGQMKIGNTNDTDNVRAFARLVSAYLNDHQVDKIAIKSSPSSGKYAASPVSSRIVGVVQLASERPVVFLAPQTINAILRDHKIDIPASLHKYQHDAYRLAVAYALRRAND